MSAMHYGSNGHEDISNDNSNISSLGGGIDHNIAGGGVVPNATVRTSIAVPPTSYQVTKRAPKACSNCHRRKVRCDAHLHPEGQPCSYCNSTGHECVLLPGRRGSTYQKTKNRLIATSATGNANTPPKQPRKSIPAKRKSEPHLALDVLYEHAAQQDNANFVAPYPPSATQSLLSPRNNGLMPDSPLSTTHETAENPSMSDEHVWVQFLDKVHDSRSGLLEQQLAQQQAPSQRQHSDGNIKTRENSADQDGDTKKRTYIYYGESMLDGAVPTVTGLHSVKDAKGPSIDSTSFLDVQSWSPPESWTTIANRKHITDCKVIPEDDKKYLLEHKKVNIFPPVEVCDRLVKLYFKHTYPNLPILDRPAFLRDYKKMIHNNAIYSLLLMHAIFYAATYHASASLIEACGFPNRPTARSYFFSRAKALHSMDAETEHVIVIQSCILLSQWWARYEEEKETRFYLTAAILLSQRMGMHRTIRGGVGLGASDKRLWKRIHWTLYNRDHISSSSLGKPAFIRSSDVDVGDLSEDDFLENWGDVDEEDARQFCPPQTAVDIKYTIQLVKLAKIYERIHCHQYSTQRPGSPADLEMIANELHAWKAELPEELSTSGYDAFRTWTPENFWPILLQLVHDRAVSLHFRPRCSPTPKYTWGAVEIPDEQTSLKDREKARKAVVASANSTFRLVEDLLRHDLLRYCPPIIQTPLFIAMVIYAEEIKLSPPSSPRFNLAQNKINLGMMALGELRKVYAACSWSFRMFEYIIERKFAPIRTPDISTHELDGQIFRNDPAFNNDDSIHGNGHGNGNNHDLPIDPLLTAQSGMMQPGTPQPEPLASGHLYWNVNDDSDLNMAGTDGGGGFQPIIAQDNGFMVRSTGDNNSDYEFDLAWMAMSGLAGDIPFHFESGAANKTPGKGPIYGNNFMNLFGLNPSMDTEDVPGLQ